MDASEEWERSASGSQGDPERPVPGDRSAGRRSAVRQGASAAQLPSLVHDLVSEVPLAQVLDDLAAAASSTTQADAHLLALRLDGPDEMRTEGIDPEVASSLADALFADGVAGRDRLASMGSDSLVVPIDAGEGPVGWLATFRQDGRRFHPDAASRLAHLGDVIGAGLVVSDALTRARRAGDVNAALLQLSRQLAHERDETVIAQRVAEAMPTVAGAERASVLLWDPEGQRLETVAAVGFGHLTEQALRYVIPLGATPALDRMITDTRPRRFDRSTSDPFIAASMEAFGHAAVSVAAIVADEEMFGLVLVLHLEEGTAATSREELRALASVADQAAIAISRRRLLAAALHAATHDHLTGLADRRLFEERMRIALRDRRHEGRAAVCFLDVDDFKEVNDTFGHEVGDGLLAEIARRLRGQVRSSDTVARISGDEFGLLLPGVTDVSIAARIVHEVARAVSEPWSQDGVEAQVGLSVGVAFAPQDGAEPQALLRAADEAMYRAKRADVVMRFASDAGDAPTSAT